MLGVFLAGERGVCCMIMVSYRIWEMRLVGIGVGWSRLVWHGQDSKQATGDTVSIITPTSRHLTRLFPHSLLLPDPPMPTPPTPSPRCSLNVNAWSNYAPNEESSVVQRPQSLQVGGAACLEPNKACFRAQGFPLLAKLEVDKGDDKMWKGRWIGKEVGVMMKVQVGAEYRGGGLAGHECND